MYLWADRPAIAGQFWYVSRSAPAQSGNSVRQPCHHHRDCDGAEPQKRQ